VVRSLWVEAVSDCVVCIFEECDNLIHLALHADNLLWLAYSSLSPDGSLNSLSHNSITRKQDLDLVIVKGKDRSLSSFVQDDPTLTTPLFQKITRFRVTRIGSYGEELMYPITSPSSYSFRGTLLS
jgi:hypothetical protein